MTRNIGNAERIVRSIVGIVLMGMAASGTIDWWGWLGVIPLATGLAGWCPPYAMLGFSTCKRPPNP